MGLIVNMDGCALVTGANQGLGLGLVIALARDLPPGHTVILGCRDAARGEAALAKVVPHKLRHCVRVELVDVSDDASVAQCGERVRAAYGPLKLVIHNAAARMRKDDQMSSIDEVFEVNNRGTRRMLRYFLPLMAPSSRFLVVASSFGTLLHLHKPLWSKFDVAVSPLSLDDIDAAEQEYVASRKDGTWEAKAWPEWINIVSKIGQVASTIIVSRDERCAEQSIAVYSINPGLFATEASRPWFTPEKFAAAPSPQQAADAVVSLALEAGLSEKFEQGSLIDVPTRHSLAWKPSL